MPTSPDSAPLVDFGRAVEIVGIVGIIVSLVFLGYELKRSNDIAEAEAVAAVYAMTNELNLALAENPALAAAFAQAQSDFEALNPEQRFAYFVLLEYVVNATETAWKYHDKGIINREEVDHYTQGLCRLIEHHPSLVAAWRANEQNRLPGFYSYVMGNCDL